MLKSIIIALVIFLGFSPDVRAECKKHIELKSVAHKAKVLEKSEAWVLANLKLSIWKYPKDSSGSRQTLERVGQILPGSRAVILEELEDDYKIISPYDKSVGWISKIQVEKTLMQDTVTREPCTSFFNVILMGIARTIDFVITTTKDAVSTLNVD